MIAKKIGRALSAKVRKMLREQVAKVGPTFGDPALGGPPEAIDADGDPAAAIEAVREILRGKMGDTAKVAAIVHLLVNGESGGNVVATEQRRVSAGVMLGTASMLESRRRAARGGRPVRHATKAPATPAGVRAMLRG